MVWKCVLGISVRVIICYSFWVWKCYCDVGKIGWFSINSVNRI